MADITMCRGILGSSFCLKKESFYSFTTYYCKEEKPNAA